MRKLRELLTATGLDVAELNDWAEAVRDTDDDQAAITAYLARREWRAMMEKARADKALAAAKERERAHIQKILSEKPMRPGPQRDRFIEIDTRVVLVAEVLAQHFPPETSIKALISEAVRRVNAVLPAFPAGEIARDVLICNAVWPLERGTRPAATDWSPALGQSEKAARDRIFARLRRRRVKGGTIPPDIASPLAERIQPRRRGVRKFGRPRSKSDAN